MQIKLSGNFYEGLDIKLTYIVEKIKAANNLIDKVENAIVGKTSDYRGF